MAHKASDEGVIAVEDAAGISTHPIEYIDIPRATFCTPNVASFGLTEAQARDAEFVLRAHASVASRAAQDAAWAPTPQARVGHSAPE